MQLFYKARNRPKRLQIPKAVKVFEYFKFFFEKRAFEEMYQKCKKNQIDQWITQNQGMKP